MQDMASSPFVNSKSRAERLREEKVEQRKRTRDLIDLLDPLVPLQDRPISSEKGSLKSRRTVLQLYEDTVAAIRSVKVGNGSQERGSVQVGSDRSVSSFFRRLDEDLQSCIDRCRVEKEYVVKGMMSSSFLQIVEMDTQEWTIVKTSAGFDNLFQNLPCSSIVGERLPLLVHPHDLWTLRMHDKPRDPVEIRLSVFRGNCHACIRCELHPITAENSTSTLFFLRTVDALPSMVPDRAWSGKAEFLSSLCGVFNFDDICSTASPWEVSSRMKDFGFPEQVQLSSSALLASESSRVVLEEYLALHGVELHRYGELPQVFSRILQWHLYFDVTAGGIPRFTMHVRLKMPEIAGCKITPWIKLLQVTLDGQPNQSAKNVDSQVRFYAQSNSPPGELHMTSLYWRKRKDGWSCFHNRDWIMKPDRCRIFGQLFRSAQDKLFEFEHVSVRVGDVDNQLLKDIVGT
mmetsp:Transcript_1477/g.4446  ORF Transcript_1477/g.4446 Transcript_1477/m.4446 type:complete len:459 (-) Transcript_1477:939-2315(-)